MAPAGRTKTPSAMNPFLAGLLIIVAVVGVIFTLEATGTTELGLKGLWSNEPVHAGNTTPVVMSVRSMKAGERVTTPKLWNAEIGTFHHQYIDKDLVEKRSYVAKPQDLVGRVLARPKNPGQAFVEADFLPKGSPEGVLGLIPEGMVSVSLDPKKIRGIELLGYQDRFDLRVMVEADQSQKAMAEKVLKERRYSSEADRLRLSAITAGPTQKLLVQSGVVIQQSQAKGRPMVVALHPDDVDPTIEALSGATDIFCTSQRSKGGVLRERIQIETTDPLAEYEWLLSGSREVEMINGGDRQRAVVPVSQ